MTTTGTITLAGDGSDTIDGQATQTIYSLGTYIVLDAASGVWDIVGE